MLFGKSWLGEVSPWTRIKEYIRCECDSMTSGLGQVAGAGEEIASDDLI